MFEKPYAMSRDNTALLGAGIELSLLSFLSTVTPLVGSMYSCYRSNIRVLSPMRVALQHRLGRHFVWTESMIRLLQMYRCVVGSSTQHS